MLNTFVRVLGVSASMGLAVSANAFVSWSNPNGATPLFSWANGGSDVGLFGSPQVLGNSFVFFPQQFLAISSNGGTVTTTDTLHVDLTAALGNRFTMIRIREIGQYAILGSGNVTAIGEMNIVDLAGNKPPQQAALATDPGFPINNGSGQWNGAIDLDLSAGRGIWTEIHLSIRNDLIAISNGFGDTAIISKNFVDSGLAIDIIPAPSGLALLGVAGLAATRRRR